MKQSREISTKSWLLCAAFCVLSFGQSCSKDNTSELAEAQTANKKVIKFLSIMLHIDSDKFRFDEEKNEYSVAEINYKISSQDAEKYYEVANVYKMKYE